MVLGIWKVASVRWKRSEVFTHIRSITRSSPELVEQITGPERINGDLSPALHRRLSYRNSIFFHQTAKTHENCLPSIHDKPLLFINAILQDIIYKISVQEREE